MVSTLIKKYFGLLLLPIFPLVLLVPSIAIALQPIATLLLFIQIFVIGISIDWSRMSAVSLRPKDIVLGNIFIYLMIPLLLFIPAFLFLKNESYLYGLMFSVLTPAAIVSPIFTSLLRGDRELSFGILITSMCIAPFVIPLILLLLFGKALPIPALVLFGNILFLVTVPTLLAFLVKKKYKVISSKIESHVVLLNFILLSLLLFILVGIAFPTLDFSQGSMWELSLLLILFFVQDFFLLTLWRTLPYSFIHSKKWVAIMISASMKNIAIAAGILIIHDPVAAVAPMIGFIPQVLLFTPWILQRFRIR